MPDVAVVVTLTVMVVAEVPLSVAGFGVTVQLACAGAPVHVKFTSELKPFVGARLRE